MDNLLIPHPDKAGWIIATPEIIRLSQETHRFIMPNGVEMSPLFSYPVDFLPDELEKIRAWAISEVNRNASAQYSTDSQSQYRLAEYLSWLSAGQPAYPDARQYPLSGGDTAILAKYGDEARGSADKFSKLAAKQKLTVSLLNQAKSEAEIVSILSRLEWR